MKLLIEMYNKSLTNSVYEYHKNKGNGSITLFYSELGNWIPKGKKAYTLKDTGNYYEFIDHHLNTTVVFGYEQVSILRELLDRLGDTKTEYKLLSEIA